MPFCKGENAKFPSCFMTFLGTFTTVLAWSGQQLTGLDEFAAGIAVISQVSGRFPGSSRSCAGSYI